MPINLKVVVPMLYSFSGKASGDVHAEFSTVESSAGYLNTNLASWEWSASHLLPTVHLLAGDRPMEVSLLLLLLFFWRENYKITLHFILSLTLHLISHFVPNPWFLLEKPPSAHVVNQLSVLS